MARAPGFGGGVGESDGRAGTRRRRRPRAPRHRTVRILGTHGVPAAYGGFETAAENIGLHLADRGWRVLVYCQIPGKGPITTDSWRGLTRVLVPEHRPGWRGTASFDLKCTRHFLADPGPTGVCLTFGYNTGILALAQRLKRVPHVINMDGMEWTRARWGVVNKGILLVNERLAGLMGTVLIADHPRIATYLRRHFGSRRVTMITYGGRAIDAADSAPVEAMGLVPGRYATMICRPVQENSVLEIVRAWSASPRGMPLVVLTGLEAHDPYHVQVRAAASDEVVFPGAIYDQHTVGALRFHSALYLHGHTVGGTNPSLVEAMGAANPVLAHDNVYNRWVAGEGSRYFTGSADLAAMLDELLSDERTLRSMAASSRARFDDAFTWDRVAGQYEHVLQECLGGARAPAPGVATNPGGDVLLSRHVTRGAPSTRHLEEGLVHDLP